MEANRRQVLAMFAGGTALAGCVSGDTGDDDNSDDDGNGAGNDPEPTDDPPESKLPDEPFPEECPAYDDVDRVICYDAVDAEEVPAILEPSTREVGADDSITFTLSNRTDAMLQTNFYNWLLSKRVDGEWYRIEPQEWPEPLMAVEPGESHEWSIAVDNAGIEDGASVSGTSGETGGTVEGLGGGHYAFRARGWFDEDTYEDAMAFAATFEIDADALAVTATDAIESTTWDGETLVADSSRGDPDSDTLGAYELERVDDYDDEAPTVITEQLLRNDQRRDAVALAERYDADRVRLEEYTGTSPIFGSRSDGVFEYQGMYYEVSTEEIEA